MGKDEETALCVRRKAAIVFGDGGNFFYSRDSMACLADFR
jgi:hypothetical protein